MHMEAISLVITYLNSIDIDYISWLLWVFYPILITFLLPGFIVLFLYLTSLGLFIYKHRRKLKDAYDHDFWDGALKTLGTLWWAQARIWHGKNLCVKEMCWCDDFSTLKEKKKSAAEKNCCLFLVF